MNTFEVRLLSPQSQELLNDIVAFIGEDASGQFSIRAHRERFVTVLVPGLSRLRHADEHWDYLAQPGGVLHFADNRLTLVVRDFMRSEDVAAVSRAMEERFASEDEALRQVHDHLTQLEREMLRRLWRLQREAP